MENNAKKVLIVEDDAPISTVLALKLNNSGFQTKVAEDGEVAILLVDNEDWDVVLLDLIIPKIDGFTVLKHIHKKNPELPVIVVSNLNQDEDINTAKDYGAKTYFVKSNTPINNVIDYIKNI